MRSVVERATRRPIFTVAAVLYNEGPEGADLSRVSGPLSHFNDSLRDWHWLSVALSSFIGCQLHSRLSFAGFIGPRAIIITIRLLAYV